MIYRSLTYSVKYICTREEACNLYMLLFFLKIETYCRTLRRIIHALWLHVTWGRLSTLGLPITYTRTHVHMHTAMFKKRFVGDMCTPYRKKITSNQDHVGRVQRFSYGGGWRGLRMSMEFETVAIATPCFLAKGCSYIWGSLPSLLFYPSSNSMGDLRALLRKSHDRDLQNMKRKELLL